MSDKKITKKDVRPGCKDIWNSFMLEGAVFGPNDIPYCPTVTTDFPESMVTWEEALRIHRDNKKKGNHDYRENSYINWYIDDYKFDSQSIKKIGEERDKYNCIWNYPQDAWKVIKHFEGIITPDFSTNQDFPYPIKLEATYRMRTFGYWIGTKGKNVINNVRWGTSETFSYCFEGIPTNSIVCIGTVGGGPRKKQDRQRFERGLAKMMEVLKPHTILVYGSSKGKCFDELRNKGVKIISFKSRTEKAFEGGEKNE